MLQVGKVVRIGQPISGPGIPSGTTVAATTTSTITLSQAATATSSGSVNLYVIDQPVAFDTVLTRLINWATNYINNECGMTSFVQQTYVNDTYSINTPRQSFILLRNVPVFPLSIALGTCTTTTNSTTVSGVTVPTGSTILPGMLVVASGIPSGTTIASIASTTSFILSNAATAGGTPTITVWDVAHIISFSWRAGTPSNPGWTAFIPDQFEVLNPRIDPISGIPWSPTGQLRVYGVLPRIYSNMIRATYSAGYPVNWANAEDHNTHWLPGDITNVCENLVVRRFKRRQLAGMSSQALEGATHSWRNDLDKEDKDVLGQYRQWNF